MHNTQRIALLLICAATTCGCATSGKAVRPAAPIVCPVLPPVPAPLMTTPNYEQQVRGILFESAPVATPKSAGSKRS